MRSNLNTWAIQVYNFTMIFLGDQVSDRTRPFMDPFSFKTEISSTLPIQRSDRAGIMGEDGILHVNPGQTNLSLVTAEISHKMFLFRMLYLYLDIFIKTEEVDKYLHGEGVKIDYTVFNNSVSPKITEKT